jgi:hypothetical protein
MIRGHSSQACIDIEERSNIKGRTVEILEHHEDHILGIGGEGIWNVIDILYYINKTSKAEQRSIYRTHETRADEPCFKESLSELAAIV